MDLQKPHEAQQRQIQSSAPETSETMLQHQIGAAWIRKHLCRKGPGFPRGQHVGNELAVMRANCIPFCILVCKVETRISRKIIVPNLSTGKAALGTLFFSGFESTVLKRFSQNQDSLSEGC